MIEKTSAQDIAPYLEDSSGLAGRDVSKVYIPQNEKEIADLITFHAAKKIPLTLSGGGTGTTGGRVPFGGCVLSMEQFKSISDIRKTTDGAVMTVGSGTSLKDIHETAEAHGYFYPPDPTEDASFIGGNISTNASGARSFKYGVTRNYIERLKVAVDGQMLDVPRGKYISKGRDFCDVPVLNSFRVPGYRMPDIKNSAGYFARDGMDLIDLFIGSEGTLACIVEADIRLLKKEHDLLAVFAFFRDIPSSLSFMKDIRQASLKNRGRGTGLNAAAMEYFDKNAVKLLSLRHPSLPAWAESVVFLEEEISPGTGDGYLEELGRILEKNKASLDETWFADTNDKINRFKKIRYDIPALVNEIVKKNGYPKAGTDIAVPETGAEEMFYFFRDRLEESGMTHLIFGHAGDNHFHVNMLPSTQEEQEKVKRIYLEFVRKALSLGGTVSAEHGIGKTKHAFLREMYGDKGIKEMAGLKTRLDTSNVLGLDNMFPKEVLWGKS